MPLLVASVLVVTGAFLFPVTSTPLGQALTGIHAAGTDVIPGFYLTLDCSHGTISLNSSNDCHDQTATDDACDSSTCAFALSASEDFGYTFGSWSSTGVTVACSTCATTTLTVHVPNPGDRYTGTLTLNTVGHFVSVTVATFVNWSSNDWVPGHVEACYSSLCSNASNGQSLSLVKGYAYTITAHLQSSFLVEDWLTDAGTLSSNSTNPTQLTATGAGTLSLIARSELPENWAGYAYSPSTSGGTVTSVVGEIVIPARAEVSFGVWVGIGGMTGTNLWQAGILYNSSGSQTPVAWWENCSTTNCSGGRLHYIPSSTFKVSPGDRIEVTLTSSNGYCTASLQDLSKLGHPKWSSGNIAFVPYDQSADWIMEPSGTAAGLAIPVSNMAVNGVFSVYASYIDFESGGRGYNVGDWVGTPLTSGSVNFSIEYVG